MYEVSPGPRRVCRPVWSHAAHRAKAATPQPGARSPASCGGSSRATHPRRAARSRCGSGSRGRSARAGPGGSAASCAALTSGRATTRCRGGRSFR